MRIEKTKILVTGLGSAYSSQRRLCMAVFEKACLAVQAVDALVMVYDLSFRCHYIPEKKGLWVGFEKKAILKMTIICVFSVSKAI